MVKKALITGITGQDGAYLAELLLEKGYEVHGIKRRASLFNTQRVDHLYQDPHEKDLRFVLHYGDLTDATNLIRIIQEVQPNEIYNLAAQSHVKVSFETPEYTANADALGTLRLLEAIRILGLKEKTRFYQASTSELYGKVQEVPQTEKTPFYPRSPYAVSKLYAYWCTVNYREAYHMFACNGILFNHESPRRGETFVTRKITRTAARIALGIDNHLFLGNLDAKRDWGHAKDFVNAIWLMLQQDEADDFVIATGVQHSVREFCELAFETMGIILEWSGSGTNETGIVTDVQPSSLIKRFESYHPLKNIKKGQEIISVDPRYFRPTEVESLIGDPTKAQDKLNWKPKISFEEMIEEMVERDLEETVREVICNRNGAEEAEALYGSLEEINTIPGKVFFVTLGERGALVVQGDHISEISAVDSHVLDPTGAGDTFCGATNAHLALGQHPFIAAQKAAALAAEMIEYPGPIALLQTAPPPVYKDNRVGINENQVQAIAQLLAAEPEATPFAFTGPDLPAVGDPHALNWFFVATLQQFSFWTTKNNRYHLPLIAVIDGEKLKGSDYLWRAYLRMLREDPQYFTTQRQAVLSMEDMRKLFRADDCSDPMPALELHLDQALSYGRDMLALNWTPQRIIEHAHGSTTPLRCFIDIMDQIGGYKEDPLRKKSSLLAMILNQRPEKFFTFGAQEEVAAVIDYHAMRGCLRTGLVKIRDSKLRAKIVNREVLLPAEEQVIRYASFEAIKQVAQISGKSIGAVDWWFFNSRKRCPEMTEPDCKKCQVDPICAHDKELFQPVLRTTNY